MLCGKISTWKRYKNNMDFLKIKVTMRNVIRIQVHEACNCSTSFNFSIFLDCHIRFAKLNLQTSKLIFSRVLLDVLSSLLFTFCWARRVSVRSRICWCSISANLLSVDQFIISRDPSLLLWQRRLGRGGRLWLSELTTRSWWPLMICGCGKDKWRWRLIHIVV